MTGEVGMNATPSARLPATLPYPESLSHQTACRLTHGRGLSTAANGCSARSEGPIESGYLKTVPED